MTGINPAYDKPSILDAFTKPSLNAGLVALLAVCGPVVAALALTAFGTSDRPFISLLMETVTLGWFGPLIVLSMIGATNYYTNKRISDGYLVRARMSALALGVAVSRARYYLQRDHPDPMTAAMYDTAAYMFGPCPDATHLSWTRQALGWYATDDAAARFPAPPQNIYAYASVNPDEEK